MSIPENRAVGNASSRAPSSAGGGLGFALALARAGMPVFCARLDVSGDPDRLRDARWNGWQNTPAGEFSISSVSSWKPGSALCGVTGVVFDVLDYDPRNDNCDSFESLSAELGDDGPNVYAEVWTPSGGRHLYIAPLGIGSHNGFMPGLDLKGGVGGGGAGGAGGGSRGFVYLPPTVRPSRVRAGRFAYRSRLGLVSGGSGVEGDPGCSALREVILRELDSSSRAGGSGSGGGGGAGGRVPVSELRQACLDASAGSQRSCLLRYVHELERRGYDAADIIVLLKELVTGMGSFAAGDPWYPARSGRPDRHLRGLLHRSGSVVADADRSEAALIAGISAAGPGGLSSGRGAGAGGSSSGGISRVEAASEIPEAATNWAWKPYLAIGELAITDGGKGQGKSLVTYDIAARITRGRQLPGGGVANGGRCGNVIIFTEEGSWPKTIVPRLRAADADLSMVYHPIVKRGGSFSLPGGAAEIRKAIIESGACVAIFDPITDLLDESINSHNDASVRRALAPLAGVLNGTGCAGWMIRHFNKNTGADARNRGGGSSAFQNRARVHTVTGELPSGNGSKFGLAMVDTNLTILRSGVLAYDIVDSDVVMESDGTDDVSYHGKIAWLGFAGDGDGDGDDWDSGGYVDISADILVGGGERARGPAPTVQPIIEQVLREMFREKDTWMASTAMKELENCVGGNVNKVTLGKVKITLGIRSIQKRKRGMAGIREWYWTTAAEKTVVQ